MYPAEHLTRFSFGLIRTMAALISALAGQPGSAAEYFPKYNPIGADA
jgi:hypothetical protein